MWWKLWRVIGVRWGAVAAGALVAIVVGVVLRRVSTQVVFPPTSEMDAIGRYESLAWLIPVLLASAVWVVLRPRRFGYSLLAGALVGHSLFYVWAVAGVVRDPHPFYEGPPSALVTLLGARPWNGRSGRLVLSDFSAQRMAAERKDGYTYVPAHEPSTGPWVVSVNPVDAETWGAAVLSSHGLCGLLVTRIGPETLNSPGTYSTTFGTLAPDAPCVGGAATPANATSTDWETIRR